MIQLTIFGKLDTLYHLWFKYVYFPFIFEESCFCSLLPSRQPPHLLPHIPGISRGSVLGCSSECPAHRGGVLSLSPLPKPVFEETLLFLILTLRTFIKLVSSRLAQSCVSPMPEQQQQQLQQQQQQQQIAKVPSDGQQARPSLFGKSPNCSLHHRE